MGYWKSKLDDNEYFRLYYCKFCGAEVECLDKESFNRMVEDRRCDRCTHMLSKDD